MSDYKPGDKIMVKVGGVEYETVIDEHGTQRFVKNPDHWLVKQIPMIWDSYLKRDIMNMNVMADRYRNGEFNQRDYAEMNMAIGYSVCGFCELSSFNNFIVENPLWARDDDNEYTNMIDSYLLAMLRETQYTLSEVIEIIQKRDGLTKEKAEEYFVTNFVSDW